MATETFSLSTTQAVSIAGEYTGTYNGIIYIIEQTGSAPDSYAVIGSFTPLKNVTYGSTQNFDDTVILPLGTYTIGATGAAGDIFFVDSAGLLIDPGTITVETPY